MATQEKNACPTWHLVLFTLYACFGFAVCVLWLYDMISYQEKYYSVSSVIIFVVANSFQCFLLYKSVFKQKIIKLIYVLLYLFFLILGIVIYMSTYNSNHHFSIYTVASVLSQILFALYGITYIMGNNQKRKEEEYLNELSESNADDINRSAIYLYNPELSDNENVFYDSNDDNASMDYSDNDYDMNEKQKYFNYFNKKEDTEIEFKGNSCCFKYPDRIDVSKDSIVGVVDDFNPYLSKNLELHNVSMFV